MATSQRSRYRPAPVGRTPTPVAALPPRDGAFHARVWLQPENLVAVCDEIGAEMFSVVDGEVTFHVRGPDVVVRWRGCLGRPGVVAV